MRRFGRPVLILLTAVATSCASTPSTSAPAAPTTPATTSSTTSTPPASPSTAPSTTTNSPTTTTLPPLDHAFFSLDEPTGGITIERGGDADFEVVATDGGSAVVSGNGATLASIDGNGVGDRYLQFHVTDDLIYAAEPTSRVAVEVEYLDTGTDTFGIQYDALDGGPAGDGIFKDAGLVLKTDTGKFQTAVFSLCDAYFANRNNGADFRIADGADGAETIRRVTVLLRPPAGEAQRINVDTCGANPFDDQPDSMAIQECIDQTCSGDTIVFTSAGDDAAYQGYQIDRTIFLVRTGARQGLTFTSTDTGDHALLTATGDLQGFVVRLFARSGIRDSGSIDDISIGYIDIESNRAERICYGPDSVGNGIGDNWGSWLPECTNFDDPWCSPGGLGMDGATDPNDRRQDYEAHPERWSTGLNVHDMVLSNAECGTMLAFGGAAGTIDSVTIDVAGDHVHAPGCEATDPDEPTGAWSDGITMYGPAHRITNNLIMDASDIGIVTFGGRDTVLSGNTIIARPGNNGMFAGIAVHPYAYGLSSGFEVTGNTVINEADRTCGGIHTGIDIGTHMWSAGCNGSPPFSSTGTPGECSSLSEPPGWQFCLPGQPCRVWGYVPEGESFTLTDNSVTGAQINYLVEGLDVRGDLVVSGNVSTKPHWTDWEGDTDCAWDGITDSWGRHHFVAHDPTIEGWEDLRIYCER